MDFINLERFALETFECTLDAYTCLRCGDFAQRPLECGRCSRLMCSACHQDKGVDHDGCKQPVFQKLSQRERRLYEKLNSLFGQVNLSKIKEEEKKEEERVTAEGTVKDKVELLIKKLTEDLLTCATCLITLSPESKGRHRTYCHP